MPAPIPPTYEDAALVLRLYELRREEKLRAAREWFRAKFFPQSFEEVKAVALGAGVENTHYRMVTTYWEMAAAMVLHGAVSVELFVDCNGEGFFLLAKFNHILEAIREKMPTFMNKTSELVKRFPAAAARYEVTLKNVAARRHATQQTQQWTVK